MKGRKSAKTSAARKKKPDEGKRAEQGITAIEVEGFKSLAKRTRVEIRPLTILAGANSSGKSSLMQGLLLLKQTLDAPYDPGPLLLHNSHVKFTSVDQMVSRIASRNQRGRFRFGLSWKPGPATLGLTFRRRGSDSLDLAKMNLESLDQSLEVSSGVGGQEIYNQALEFKRSWAPGWTMTVLNRPVAEFMRSGGNWADARRLRCFLVPLRVRPGPAGETTEIGAVEEIDFSAAAAQLLRSILHLPGLRGNPERAYPVAAVESTFSGTFDIYTASVILSWQKNKDARLVMLDRMAERLGLTWKVRARQLDATRVEILVGRLSKKGNDEEDLVNLADVGFGVSQVLPVVVALLQAQPGQLVYIEQPELHLHPRAQTVMAGLLAEAASRGVRVVAETHSSLLLLSLQTLVAKGEIQPEEVILHWFERGTDGATRVTSAEVDREGAYGAWPEDFGAVEAQADDEYLDTVEQLLGVR